MVPHRTGTMTPHGLLPWTGRSDGFGANGGLSPEDAQWEVCCTKHCWSSGPYEPNPTIRFIFEWHRQSPTPTDAEKRTDPEDEMPYTLEEITQFYWHSLSMRNIEDYWNSLKPFKARFPEAHAEANHEQKSQEKGGCQSHRHPTLLF